MLVWLFAAWAQESCEYVTFAEIAAIEAPAVVVLGERHGFQPDLARAAKVVRSFDRRAPVTVALEAVHSKYQPVLDGFAEGKVEAVDLPALTRWDDDWGFPYAPYAPLVTASRFGAKVVGAGLDLGPRPEDRAVPLPPRYIDVLRPAMAGHTMPPEKEGGFVQAMAWRDFRIAEAAMNGWSGEGYLVVVTGRGHVEGGKGVAWQAQRMTQAPVHAFVLKPGPEPPCWEGDRLWR